MSKVRTINNTTAGLMESTKPFQMSALQFWNNPPKALHSVPYLCRSHEPIPGKPFLMMATFCMNYSQVDSFDGVKHYKRESINLQQCISDTERHLI